MFSTIDVMVAQAHIDQLNELADAKRPRKGFLYPLTTTLPKATDRPFLTTSPLPHDRQVHRADPLTLLRFRHRQQLVHLSTRRPLPSPFRVCTEPETRDCFT